MAGSVTVGACVRDHRHRVLVVRADGRGGRWDIVRRRVDAGDSPRAAAVAAVAEETGGQVCRVEARLPDHRRLTGLGRRVDYLVTVADPTARTRRASAWVGPDELDPPPHGPFPGDRALREVVARAARSRLTDRLLLEPIGPAHARDLRRLHRFDEIAAWQGGRWTRAAARRNARAYGQSWETRGFHKWMAYDRVTGDLVGRGGLAPMTLDGRPRLEIGWTVRPDRWGRGYATEIGRAGLAFAFAELRAPEVVAFTEPDNGRSRAVMERLGMTYAHDVTTLHADDIAARDVVAFRIRSGPATTSGADRGVPRFVLYSRRSDHRG